MTVDPQRPTPSVIVFQYNPETVTRTLSIEGGGGEGGRSEAVRLAGPPAESLRMEVELDATDALAMGDQLAATLGIHPQLAALETLLYPTVAYVVANTALLAAGTIEVVPPDSPLTVLVWGAARVVPVRLTEFSVVEEAHDSNLNPIRAKVSLGLRVLSYQDVELTHPAYHLFLVHQQAKETMAALARGAAGALPAVAVGRAMAGGVEG